MLLRNVLLIFACSSLCAIALSSTSSAAEPPTAAQIEFFETRIRPVLVEHCYECHNSTKSAEGGFAIDHRAAMLKGGDDGAVIVPGNPVESRLLAILRHEVPGLKMPKGNSKLGPKVIADFEKWIAIGAPDPRDKAPSVEELVQATSWAAVLEKRKKWWSFQPIRNPAPPTVRDTKWSAHPIDRFVLAKLEAQGVEPNEMANSQTLVRRLFFVLIGLPPSAEEAESWSVKLQQPGGYEELVDHLLGSAHFGEQIGRAHV